MTRQLPGMNRIVGTFVNPVVQSLDVDSLVQRVDVNALAQRVDLNALLDSVDMERVVERAQVASMVTGTAGTMAVSALDLGRQQLVSLDALLCYAAVRGIRRMRVPGADADGKVAGQPAGPFTRLLAYVIDTFVVAAIFALGVVLCSYLAGLFTGHTVHPQREGLWWVLVGVAVGLVYFSTAVALWGQTLGKALLGLRVIHYGGGRVRAAPALVRALVFPFSLILGLGMVEIVLGRERRALHDHAARTTVVYDWGGRAARLPPGVATWLAAREQGLPGSVPQTVHGRIA